jgi:hypothetical protein
LILIIRTINIPAMKENHGKLYEFTLTRHFNSKKI